MRCLFASSEVVGFAKTGGLADVSAALPQALVERGHECVVVMPLYRCIRTGDGHPPVPTKHILNIPIRGHYVGGSVWKSVLPNSQVPIYLIAQADYYERDNPREGRNFYQFTRPDGKQVDYLDNCERYVFFCRAILELIRLLDFWPDVIHINDWHTGLVPVYLKTVYRNHPTPAFRPLYRRLRTLFTIHNIAYQGLFEPEKWPVTGLPESLFNPFELEFYGRFNFLKAGLVFSDLLSTVSPTYGREIQTPAFGCGLQGVLYERRKDLYGIVNGVDYQAWDPAIDPFLATNYDLESVQKGKALCKKDLQEKVGLPVRPRTPIFGMISRLVPQKGLDLILQTGNHLLQQDVQLIVLGQGNRIYEEGLHALARQYPDKVSIQFALDEAFAHQVEAGVDMHLMPSLYEPCGLNQLYSLKYGTLPIVRKTGGLADTVVDATPETLAHGTATGFMFNLPTPLAFLEVVERALVCYHKQPDNWQKLMRTGMQQDWSWNQSAAQYEELYRKLVSQKSECL